MVALRVFGVEMGYDLGAVISAESKTGATV
jgi:hypothetical protein